MTVTVYLLGLYSFDCFSTLENLFLIFLLDMINLGHHVQRKLFDSFGFVPLCAFLLSVIQYIHIYRASNACRKHYVCVLVKDILCVKVCVIISGKLLLHLHQLCQVTHIYFL